VDDHDEGRFGDNVVRDVDVPFLTKYVFFFFFFMAKNGGRV